MLWMNFGIKDLIDVLLVAFFLYQTYRLMKSSGTLAIFSGVVSFIVVWILISQVLEMRLMTPNLKAFDEYDFSKADYSGQTIILANQLAVPAEYVPVLESFVSKGGKLIVDGLTGFYDGYVHNQMLTGFSLRKLFGGSISEFKKIDEPYFYHLEGFQSEIPGLMWKGTIRKDAAQTLSADNNEPLPSATRNHFGKGEVVWIPSLLGAGWSLGNYSLSSCNHLSTKEFA